MLIEIIQFSSGFIIGAVLGKVFDRSIQHMERSEKHMECMEKLNINCQETEVFKIPQQGRRW